MRVLLVLITVGFSATAFAQTSPPKTVKPRVQPKLQTPTGCKLIGTVKGTKIWAGDCTDATGLRGAAPAATTSPSLPEQPAGAIPPDQKQ